MYLKTFGSIENYYKERGTTELRYTTKSEKYRIYETHLERSNDFFFDGLCVEDVQSKYVIHREDFDERKPSEKRYYDALAFCLYFLNKNNLDNENVIEEIDGYEIKIKKLPEDARHRNNDILDVSVYVKGSNEPLHKGVNNFSSDDEYFYNDIERKVLDCKEYIEKLLEKLSSSESSNYTRVRNNGHKE